MNKLFNKHRSTFLYLFINEQLNIHLKDKIFLNFKNEFYLVSTTIKNIKNDFQSSNIEFNISNLNLKYFFQKLINLEESNSILHLILNKLCIVRELETFNYPTYLYILNLQE